MSLETDIIFFGLSYVIQATIYTCLQKASTGKLCNSSHDLYLFAES